MNTLGKRFLYIAFAVLLLAAAFHYRSGRFQQGISREILRFHIMANSDSEKDQSVKLKVRDEIGSYMHEKLRGTKDMTECLQIARENLPKIAGIAERVIAREGCDYSAGVRIAEADFPKKQYGSYAFPAGTYQALVVTLGQGEGHNWWCVMYPNMCFANSVYEVTDDTAKEELQAVLTEEEYEELMAVSSISVKFKYWEKLKELTALKRDRHGSD